MRKIVSYLDAIGCFIVIYAHPFGMQSAKNAIDFSGGVGRKPLLITIIAIRGAEVSLIH
jgi:hypothetical protein